MFYVDAQFILVTDAWIHIFDRQSGKKIFLTVLEFLDDTIMEMCKYRLYIYHHIYYLILQKDRVLLFKYFFTKLKISIEKNTFSFTIHFSKVTFYYRTCNGINWVLSVRHNLNLWKQMCHIVSKQKDNKLEWLASFFHKFLNISLSFSKICKIERSFRVYSNCVQENLSFE